MAVPHCPRCNATTTQALVSTLNCLACGATFDFDGVLVSVPDVGITTTDHVAVAEPAVDKGSSKSRKAAKASS